MSSSALFQILYQHETLFHLEEDMIPPVPTPKAEQIKEEPLETVGAPAQHTMKSELPASPSLPIQAAAPAEVNPPQLPDFPGLKHKILILIDEAKQQEMLANEAQFLDNILKAVGHSTANADILNFSYLPGQDARTVLAEKKTNFFITFGVPLIKLHLDLLLAPYTPKNIDGIWFLLADPLVVIEADRNLKKKLWQALQQMFGVS